MSLEWWKAFFEIGGVVLLLLTFAFAGGALIVNNRLNTIQAAQLRQFDKNLTDAKTELGKQQERAANADSRVAGLEQDVAAAKTEMAKQQARAATAERELLELKERLAHRRISEADHDKFVATLLPFAKSRVEIERLGDAEASRFADDLLSVFRDAKWNVTVQNIGMISPPRYGLECIVDDSTPAGKAIAPILRSLPTATIRIQRLQQGLVAVISFGLKPPA